MITVPILRGLRVENYGLFPGDPPGSGLDLRFLAGTTLILGTNGLGKTTLVTLLYRLLTGPYDIPSLSGRGQLGTARTNSVRFSAARKRMFADRVRDGAETAMAELEFSLGDDVLVVRRSMRNLELVHFAINDREIGTNETTDFQREVLARAGLSTFGDWILLLRYLVFYSEDRRALVWDPTAQRQVLRFLLLDLPVSIRWTSEERAILELDSRVRNMSATLYQWERALDVSEETAAAAPDIREQLRGLEGTQTMEVEQRDALDSQLLELDESRERLRVRQLSAQQLRESAYRDLERLRLSAIAARFPDRSATARYILSQFMTGNECLVCGNVAEAAAASYAERLHGSQCVVCGTPVADLDAPPIAQRELDDAASRLDAADEELTAAVISLGDARTGYDTVFSLVHSLSASIAARSREIDALVDRLPPDEADLHQSREDLSKLRRQLQELREQLRERRDSFRTFIFGVNRSVAEWSETVTREFMVYARGFLVERAELLWSPHKARVGETGEFVEFPSFQLNLASADFDSPVRRSGPDQVSESQREFIDLAFRMALMSAATVTGTGTLVIDAPESSLDAVFVGRAADVLGEFGAQLRGNRVVVASNLVESDLIPSLLEIAIPRREQADRVVDLLTLAAPTAAVREHADEYASVRDELLARS